ncbi:MAG: hypothetical protein KAW56_13000 [Candidatus Marinimicrobia bacterium]|nr:hypothetical protein [Candidatus Neomarinimicrobiota bacterium]
MKPKRNHVFISLMIAMLMILTGCREITTTTRIFSDGSCERTVFIEGDSSDVFSGSYPLPLDSSWTFDIKKDTSEKVQYFYSAKKSFKRVSDLNNEYLYDSVSTFSKIDRSIKLKKHFRWFFTILTYREIYRDANPFKQIPVSDYLSDDEINILFADDDDPKYFAGKDSLKNTEIKNEVEEKFEIWLGISVFEEFYQAFLQGAVQLGDSNLTQEIIISKKDILTKTILADTISFFDIDEEKLIDSLITICEYTFQTPCVWKLLEEGNYTFRELKNKLSTIENVWSEGYTNEVLMPGLLIDTNAETIEGNKVVWDVEIDKYFLKDFEMWVESRIVNRWAVPVTAVIIVVICIGLVVAAFRRRKM